MAPPSFVVYTPVPGPKFCGLSTVTNFTDSFKKGRKLEPWPADVRFCMDPNHPKSNQLADCHTNFSSAIVVSKRLKDFIEAEQIAHVEYLPISIVDHKGNVASADYFVINPYRLQDCIDQTASKITWNAIDPTLMSACYNMTIDEERISADAKIFRLEHYPSKVLFARALADKIREAKFTGVTFIEIADVRY
jgi:hypothetical protein